LITSDEMRSSLVTEFRLIKDRMIEEEHLNKKIWWFSGAYGIVFRVLNFEYDPDLQFLHFILQSSYKAISHRINTISAGQSRTLLPDDICERLALLLESIAEQIENDESFYHELRTLSNLSYLTTGNGYYLSLKGIEVAPQLVRDQDILSE